MSYIKESYSVIFPPPTEVFSSLYKLLLSKEVISDVFKTLQRSIVGFLTGAVIGITTGTIMGIRPFIYDVMSPLINMLYSLPALAIVPVLMVWMGLSNEMIITIVALTSFIQISLNTATGIKNVPESIVNSAKSMGAGTLMLIQSVYIPLAAPSIFTGLRLGIEQAWKITIATEMLIGANGLGNMLVESESLLRVDILFATIIVIGIVGYTFERVLSIIEKRYSTYVP